jgi:hypothetical protein
MGMARGMLGSIELHVLDMENCHAGWKSQYKGHCKDPTIILEAVVEDRWVLYIVYNSPKGYKDIYRRIHEREGKTLTDLNRYNRNI